MRLASKLFAAAAAALFLSGSPATAAPFYPTISVGELSAVTLAQDRDRRRDRDRLDDRRSRGGFNLYIGPGGPSFQYGRPYRRCGWLRQRAIQTGSRYWWTRYRRCRGW